MITQKLTQVDLKQAMEGQQVYVCDLHTILHKFPQVESPRLNELREDVRR